MQTKHVLLVSEGKLSAYSSPNTNCFSILLSLQLISVFSVSTLFLILLFAPQPSKLPLLMWQAWEMKS